MTAPSNAHFERRAGTYLRASQKGLWSVARSAEWRAIRERLSLTSGLDVLDAGCGAGYYSLRMREAADVRIEGVDAARSMAEAYRALGFEGRHGSIETHRPGRAYDRILVAGVLEFIERPDDAVANLAALLKPYGKIVCLIPDSGPAGKIYQLVHRAWSCPTFLRTPRWYFQLCGRFGLTHAEFAKVTPISAVFSLRYR